MDLYFKGATLRHAPEVFHRRTSTMYHVGGHEAQGQARMQLKAITREDVWMLVVDVFYSLFFHVIIIKGHVGPMQQIDCN